MPKALDWQQDGESWPNRAASRFVLAGGCRWHVQRAGKGAQLLLIHGTGAATHSWADLFAQLAGRFDTLAMDLPGHGFTTAVSRQPRSLPDMSRALEALMQAEAFVPRIIVGHSAGAAIGVNLATAAPQPRPLVIGLNAALEPLSGVAGIVGPVMANALRLNPFAAGMLARSVKDERRVARLISGTGSQVPAAYLGNYARLFRSPAHIAGTIAMMASWDLSGLMQRSDRTGVRLHLIAGERDKAVPPDAAADFARRMDGVTAEILAGLGHLAHEEDAGRVSASIFRAVDAARPAGGKGGG